VIKSGGLRLDTKPKWQVSGDGNGWLDGLIYPGFVIASARADAPAGWLFCRGQSLVVASYLDLHGAIGYTFGGSGLNFNLPDLRRRPILGVSDVASTLALGANDGVAIASRSWSHTHSIPGQTAAAYVEVAAGAINVPTYGDYNGHAHGGNTGTVTPSYLSMNYLIKT
jgi:microcystin-dependent protein